MYGLAAVGLEIGSETIFVDPEAWATLEDETLIELDETINRVIWESRPISWDDVPITEARECGSIIRIVTTRLWRVLCQPL